MSKAKTTHAVATLHRRGKGAHEPLSALEIERFAGGVSRMIRSARRSAGLTQKQLAERMGVATLVIQFMESSNCNRHSISLLVRIAIALGRNLKVTMTAPPPS